MQYNNAMSERPRPWFQIHLSTGVILMVLVAILLGLNIATDRECLVREKDIGKAQSLLLKGEGQGFPFTFYIRGFQTVYSDEGFGWGNPIESDYIEKWRTVYLILDVIISVFLVIITTVGCEYLILRREKRKSESSVQQ